MEHESHLIMIYLMSISTGINQTVFVFEIKKFKLNNKWCVVIHLIIYLTLKKLKRIIIIGQA